MELEQPQELPAYRTAFAAGLQHGPEQRNRLHQDCLLTPPWLDIRERLEAFD